MEFTRDPSEFARLNQSHILKFLRRTLHTTDENYIQDRLQEFYLQILKNKTLEKYDENCGCSFESYVLNNCFFGNRSRAKKYVHIQMDDSMTDDAGTHEQTIRLRIIDLQSYLKEHGGEKFSGLLDELIDRINGEDLTDPVRSYGYRKLLKKFLDEEKI